MNKKKVLGCAVIVIAFVSVALYGAYRAYVANMIANAVETSLALENGFDAKLPAILEKIKVSEDGLRATVETLAKPRHYIAQPEENKNAGEWILQQMQVIGLQAEFQGEYRNVIGCSPNPKQLPWIFVGAHYDSVAESAGADDNASGVAAMLEIGRIICAQYPDVPIALVAFNAEEIADHSLPEEEQVALLGSSEFFGAVSSGKLPRIRTIGETHVMEMVGFVGDQQTNPEGLPIFNAPGNFISILCDLESAEVGASLLQCAAADGNSPYYAMTFTVPREAVQIAPDLGRSDHYPAWLNKIRSTMVTDTANFRNPHYHMESDKPESLNYDFMAFVIRIHVASIVSRHI